jgi:hypothetical protein
LYPTALDMLLYIFCYSSCQPLSWLRERREFASLCLGKICVERTRESEECVFALLISRQMCHSARHMSVTRSALLRGENETRQKHDLILINTPNSITQTCIHRANKSSHLPTNLIFPIKVLAVTARLTRICIPTSCSGCFTISFIAANANFINLGAGLSSDLSLGYFYI